MCYDVHRRDLRIHSLDKKNFVLVVHSHNDKKFSVAAIEIRPEGIFPAHEVVGVACSSGVSHLGHFLRGRHALWDNVRRDSNVENQITVLQLDMPHRAALHEFLPGHRVSRAHFSEHARVGLHGWIVRLIALIRRHGRDGGNVDVDLAHLVLAIEVHLRTMELATLDGFGRPLVPLVIIVVVLLVVIGRRRRGKTWRDPWAVGWMGVVILRVVSHVPLDVCESG